MPKVAPKTMLPSGKIVATKDVAKVTKNGKKVTVVKNAAVGKTEERPSEKAMRLAKTDTKKIPAGKVEKATGITKKAVAKAVVPEKKKTTAKRTPKGYTPQDKSMRYFIMGALKQGLATTGKIKIRAAKLAAKAGIKQYATPESFKAFDVAFFVKMLEEKGIEIEREGEKLAISG